MPVRRFEEHMDWLLKHRVPMTMADALESGAPDRVVVVTFDDGYRNFIETALPVLAVRNVPATLFVMTHQRERMWMDRLETLSSPREVTLRGTRYRLPQELSAVEAALDALPRDARDLELQELGGAFAAVAPEPDPDRDLMSWDEIREVRDTGIEIGSHSDIHEPLTRRGDVRAALQSSLEVLRRELGRDRFGIAYPFGDHDPAVVTAAREAGFEYGVTTRARHNPRDAHPFTLGRYLLGADDDLLRLRASLAGLRARG